ncbi:hypothetical protein QK290_07490 [Pseudarthrobacter sp. AL07]|uniref:hypothetical protein n=1 Tax=unclassified Pseudarthrobacter TaxID=2647000 RepID=UPI00249CB8A5|nr:MULTISPECIES: hypothetical protein [unclassified Pseudarthrobacter]MDI3194294.1 hypothetical protein [Pseudarthrobacter sp. AL20]MDI3208361.1 hypothetical protein [Pseudarthrobacter sp. AL07]
MITRHTLRDEQVVDELLLETGSEDAPDLRAALLDLRCFVASPAVVPSAELEALMATGPASLDARRRRNHRRTAFTAVAIAASMGIGTAAVAAADPGFREHAQQAFTTVIDAVTHGYSGKPTPASGPGATKTPARVPDLPAPAQGLPAPAQGDPGRSGTNPASSPVIPPANGTANGPAPAVPQRQGNHPAPASPSFKAHR